MPRNTSALIVKKIKAFAEDPASIGNNVKRLKGITGAMLLRIRVGDWRVIIVNGTVIDVIKIAPRGSADN